MKAWKSFKKSFKLRLNFLYVILLDLIFYIITVPCFFLAIFLIKSQAERINVTSLQAAMASASTQDVAQMQAALQAIKSLVIVMVLAGVLFFVIALFSYSFSRSLIWNYLLKKKFKYMKYLKFVVLNLMLIIPAAVLLLLSFLLMKVNVWAGVVVIYVVMVLIAYFVFMLYIEYTKTARIFMSIGNAFKRINKNTAVSYLLCLLVYGILFGFYMIVSWYSRLSSSESAVFYLILALLFFAWMRLYVLKVQG